MSDTPDVGDFCWNELATTNVKAAKEFYSKAFGWEFSDHDMDGKTYSMIKHKDKEFAGIWEIPKDQSAHTPPHWMSYITVKNLAESLEKVKKLGATVKAPITQAGDFGQFAIITDPTGANIALWEALKTC